MLRGFGLVLISLSAACSAPPATTVPSKNGTRAVHLDAASPRGLDELSQTFEAANPGYSLAWMPNRARVGSSDSALVVFVQRGEGRATVAGASTDFAVGDIVLLRPREEARFEPPPDLLAFSTPVPLPVELPSIVRPDWDPRITDTPGGCATESGAYRRILLTWEGRNGPYLYRALNAHRVRIVDSFTHYHPREGGFDELYLVQHAAVGARLLVGEELELLLDPSALDAEHARSLLREIEVRAGDLVYLPRGVAHRGVGGILAQVITVPGFVPGAEIGVDEAIQAVNARFDLKGELALPFHRKQPRVEIRPGAEAIEVEIDGKPFTTYRFGAGDPCFFPVRTPAGIQATRAFPFEERDGEARDHPHHRSIWFAHGSINGQDFWHEGPEVVRQTALVSHASGEGRGAFEVEDEWLGADGALIARDRRVCEPFALEDAWGIDIEIALVAGPDGIVVGDTKEGTMAVRLAAGMAVTEGGALLDTEGRRDGEVWGKRARWMLASGRGMAVVLMDHPANLRHPTTWHARTYGLVAANPFGLSDFEGAPRGAGEFRAPPNGELRLRYRLLLFDGSPGAARLDAIFAEFGGR